MTRTTYLAALIGSCMTACPAMASTCSIDPIAGLLNEKGAQVTMRVGANDPACGTQLWVQQGVIPFTRIQQVKAPEHGDLSLNDSRQFTYHPQPGYSGPDSFELIAFGNTAGGSAVTGRLHVAVSVSKRN